MLSQLDLTFRVGRDEYKAVVDELNGRLAELQRAAKALGIPVLIVLEGFECSGKGTLANELLQPLDPRGVKVHAINAPTQDERFHPFLWRFWSRIPSRGQIVILDASWYHQLLQEWATGELDAPDRQHELEAIGQFERQLVERGVVLLKCWLHIDRKEQRRRFKAFQSDEATAWRVTEEGKTQQRYFDDHLSAVEAMLESSNHPEAPWTLVEANHRRVAHITVLRELVSRVDEALHRAESPVEEERDGYLEPVVPSAVLARVDLTNAMDDEEYAARRKAAQRTLRRLQHEVYLRRIPVIVALEGWDAAGKGGAIKRLTEELDPRGYEVTSISAPTPEERAYPYWWRFWCRLPKDGHIGIFDRTWYGRVLVERIEGFCTTDEWQRGYSELNEFEAQLVHHGAVVVKFWLHIDKDEQKRRFESRSADPARRWKITDEDWRNREKWGLYEVALEEMFRKTSTYLAPWVIVEANDKRYARVRIMEYVCQAIQRRLGE